MPDEAFDVAVIGGGSAGYVGAIRGAQLGLKVAVIEKHKVVVKGSGEAINARNLVVATGSRPKSLAGLTMDGDRVINSDHAVNLEQMPKSIVIVGAGAVGTEFACVYNGYGADVTLVEFLPTLLPLEDAEVGQQLAKVLTKRGIKVLTGAQVQPDTLKRVNGKMTVAVKSGEQTQTIEGERLLVAVGREGITDGFGLEKLDIQVEKGYIRTDEHYRTGHPNVYAAGDVIGNFLLAHVAYYEGEHIMEHIAGTALAKLLESTPWEIGASIAPHPTVSESVKEAALAVDGVAIHI